MRPLEAGPRTFVPFGLIVLLQVTLSAAGHQSLAAQEAAEAQVLAAVEQLFRGMAERDPDVVAEALLPGGQFVVVRVGSDGTTRTTITSHEDFVGLVAAADRPLIERFWDPEIFVHGPLAVVWTPYDLWRGDELSHCGIDAFTLVRIDDTWRISGGSYTIEPDGCPPDQLDPAEPV